MKLFKIAPLLIAVLLIVPNQSHALRKRTVFAAAVVGTYVYTQLYPESESTRAINAHVDHAQQEIKNFGRKKGVTDVVMSVGDAIEDVGAELKILFKRLTGQSYAAEEAKNRLRKKTRSTARSIDEHVQHATTTTTNFLHQLIPQ